jgi:hypothetical protein
MAAELNLAEATIERICAEAMPQIGAASMAETIQLLARSDAIW